MRKADRLVVGNVVLGDRVIKDGAVAIKDGKVAAVGRKDMMPPAEDVIDAGKCLVLPGAIDGHVHSFGSPTEGITNSTRAAAAGGVTTIVDHPLDLPHAPVLPEELAAKRERCEQEAVVDFAFLGAVTPESIGLVAQTHRLGLVGYKILMSGTAPNRMKHMNDGELYDAFREVAKTGLFAGLHAENDHILKYLEEKFKAEGNVYPLAHAEAHPPVSETEAVASAILFAKAAGARVHFFHLSVPESVDIVQREKRDYPYITSETCPHYLALSLADVDRLGAKYKINPPLREKAMLEGMWEKLRRNELDMITSDHAPHHLTTKQNRENIFANSSGAPGVETIFPVVFSEGVAKGRITLGQCLNYLVYNPARLFGLYPRKGNLYPGADADIMIFDPGKEWVVHEEDLHYAAGWTPYEGMKLTGKAITTILRGEVVYREGEVLAQPGYGRYLERSE